MPCWVVPAVASEIWNVPVEQIISAVQAGRIPSKRENGFTFIDVAPEAPTPTPAVRPATSRRVSLPYKPVRLQHAPGEPIPLPRPAEVVSPVEREALAADPESAFASTGATPDDPTLPEPLSMGDWRRGRRHAAGRRMPPGQAA